MNSPAPVPTPFQVALERYQNALNYLDTSHNKSLKKAQALEIITARDVLHKQMEAEAEISVDMRSKLIEQDNRLKQKSYKITQVLDLAEYRETLPISAQAWWWHLESRESLHPCNRFDWLLRIGKLVLLGVNFTLIGTIATRFLSGGSGLLEIGGVIFSTFISLLQTENALTRTRQKGFVKLMKFLGIAEHCYEEIQFSVTVIVFAILLGIYLNFSWFSEFYKQEGNRLQSPPPASKAIELDPDNLDAHYKLATLYEELQDLTNGKKHYLIAAKGGFIDAYNNLAYWYLRDNKNAEAVELLEKAKRLLAEKDEKLDQFTEDEKRNLAVQKYSIYKSLGWARFKQNRSEDAIPNLLVAIGIAENPAYQKFIRNPGAAFCIYAQLLEKQNKKLSQENWRKCLNLAQGRVINTE
ncbi:MAG: tetratricopeptide repeat protein [Microcystis aeruginosa Ma_QC_Ch_20071001_M135]|nr:MAG: tetratricopeptide repeat protein [Microcystis aeruginosa Ma_QC_Ch_20071001_M135]